jgi:hypothetical protein
MREQETGSMCVAARAAELREAVERRKCPVVLLSNSSRQAYLLADEIVVGARLRRRP